MIFIRESFKEQVARRGKWRRWFAWYPVRVSPTETCWLEYVYKKELYNDELYFEPGFYSVYAKTALRGDRGES